jgi:hypothetical protein
MLAHRLANPLCQIRDKALHDWQKVLHASVTTP